MLFKRLVSLLTAFLFIFSVTVSASIYESYTSAQDNVITLDSGLVIACHLMPSEILEHLAIGSDDCDIFIFPLEYPQATDVISAAVPLSIALDTSALPDTLYSALTRDSMLHAFPLSINVYSTTLVTTHEMLKEHEIDYSQLPATVSALLTQSIEWYQSGKLDHINLIRSYDKPESIVYYTLTKYLAAYHANPEHTFNDGGELHSIIADSLQLVRVMETHHAFDSEHYLFVTPAADTGFTNESVSANLDRLSRSTSGIDMILVPQAVTDTLGIDGYYTGVVAIVNPYSKRFDEAVALLDEQPIDTATMLYLNPAQHTPNERITVDQIAAYQAALPKLTIQSAALVDLALENSLFQYAKQLVDGTLSIEDCIAYVSP